MHAERQATVWQPDTKIMYLRLPAFILQHEHGANEINNAELPLSQNNSRDPPDHDFAAHDFDLSQQQHVDDFDFDQFLTSEDDNI